MLYNEEQKAKFKIAVQMLQEIDIDGESTQHLLDEIGMLGQITAQVSKPLIERFAFIREDLAGLSNLTQTLDLGNKKDEQDITINDYLGNIEDAIDLSLDVNTLWKSVEVEPWYGDDATLTKPLTK